MTEELERMDRIEGLTQVLRRLKELKEEGQQEGIEEKITEVQEQLKKYI